MIDMLKIQFSLLPEGSNEFRATLHRLQPSARNVADLGQMRRAQVGDLVLRVANSFLSSPSGRPSRSTFSSRIRRAAGSGAKVRVFVDWVKAVFASLCP
jgi:hypothetical protein